MISIPFTCDFYVDQGRKIGDDPVGYKCSNDAVYEGTNGALMCNLCLHLESGRIQLGSHYGKEYQIRIMASLLETK